MGRPKGSRNRIKATEPAQPLVKGPTPEGLCSRCKALPIMRGYRWCRDCFLDVQARTGGHTMEASDDPDFMARIRARHNSNGGVPDTSTFNTKKPNPKGKSWH
jgi:hypothetical protein